MQSDHTPLICARCGGAFHRKPSHRDRARFCSRACFWATRRPPLTDLFWARVDRSGECWTWTGRRSRFGYGLFSCHQQTPRTQPAHRVAWRLVNGLVPVGLFVCHHCDNPPCVRLDHLFLGTPADNNADMVAKGRQARGAQTAPKNPARGERNAAAKLTDAKVRMIRELRRAGLSQHAIADQMEVSQVAVSLILRGVKWRHV